MLKSAGLVDFCWIEVVFDCMAEPLCCFCLQSNLDRRQHQSLLSLPPEWTAVLHGFTGTQRFIVATFPAFTKQIATIYSTCWYAVGQKPDIPHSFGLKSPDRFLPVRVKWQQQKTGWLRKTSGRNGVNRRTQDMHTVKTHLPSPPEHQLGR